MPTITGSYVASGRNPSVETQYMRLNYTIGTISVSGTTASSEISVTMYVKRDSYGPTYGKAASCYIIIDGTKTSKTVTKTINTSWVEIMSASKNVTYSASTNKTVTLAARFSISSTSKLTGLVIPASKYAYGTGKQTGSNSFTLSKQVTACIAPTSISLSRAVGEGSIITPNEAIKISWSGAQGGVSNTITSYQIYYRITNNGDAPTSTIYTGTKNVLANEGETSGSTTIELNGATRGYKIVAGVICRGSAGASYYSEIKTGGSLRINSIPASPIVSSNFSTVKSTGDTVNFTVSPGSDLDTDQTKTLYYSKSLDGEKILFTSPLEIFISKGDNSVFFYTYDGLEYSSATNKTISINVKPVINSLNINKVKLEGINETENIPLVKQGNYSANLNKTVTSYSWYFAQSAEPEVDILNNQLFYTDAILSNYNFSNLSIIKGNYYKIGLIVNDGYENSDIFWEDESSQMPRSPVAATINSIVNSITGENIEGTNFLQFEQGITMNWTNPTISLGMLNILKANIIYQTRPDASSSWGDLIESCSGEIESGLLNVIKCPITIPRGYQIKFGVRITDIGQDFIDIFSDSIYSRASLPFFGNTILNITGFLMEEQPTIKPYTNTNSIGFSGIKATSENGAEYFLQCTVNDKNVIINLASNISALEIEQGDSIQFSIDSENINSLLKDDRLKKTLSDNVWNDKYTNVIYTLYIKDFFGNISSNSLISSTTVIDFIEAPFFENFDTIQMGIQYYFSNLSPNLSSILYPSVDLSQDATTINNSRMFNPGEAIVFKIPKPKDYNEDISFYKIFVAREDTKPLSISKNLDYEQYNYVYLTDFNVSNTNQEDENTLIYQYPISSYLQNKFLIFYITAIDSKGNISNKLFSNTYLVGCRKQNPSLSLNAAEVTQDNKISINYTLSDIGGSQFVKSIYQYKASLPENSYPNFERNISIKVNDESISYIPKALIEIQYCLDGNFENKTSENYASQLIQLDQDYSSLGGSLLSGDIFDFGNKKLYIRIKLILTTGFGENNENLGEDFKYYNIVSTTTGIVTYYYDMPTVSHRAHHVGINTNVFNKEEEDEILVISDFLDRKKIVLIGTDTSTGEAKEYRIEINLKQGSINGAKIDGGSWD